MCQWIIVGCFLGAVHFIFCQMDIAWQNSDWAKDSVIRKQIIVLRASQIARINNDFKMDVIKIFFSENDKVWQKTDNLNLSKMA